MLSRLCESEPVSDTSGRMSASSGSSGERNSGPRASAQLRLPWIGVDLAVVREIAVRMREPPLRQRVGREALVEHRHRGLEPRVVQIRDRTAPGAAASPCP